MKLKIRPDEARALSDARCALRKLIRLYQRFGHVGASEGAANSLDIINARHRRFLMSLLEEA